MSEIARPGEYFFEPDARVNVIGIIAAVPMPVRQKPTIDGQNVGKITASNIPAKIRQELAIKVLDIPMISTTLSERNLDRAMQII